MVICWSVALIVEVAFALDEGVGSNRWVETLILWLLVRYVPLDQVNGEDGETFFATAKMELRWWKFTIFRYGGKEGDRERRGGLESVSGH